MRFVHAADLHLDSPLRNLALHDDAALERMRRATRDAFEKLIDFCLDERVAFLLVPGDLYDRDTPNMQIAVFLRKQLLRLQRAGIRCIVLRGNHDAANKITSALALPDNTRILDDRQPETVIFNDLPCPVALHGQSFAPGPVLENLAAAYPAPLRGHLNIGLLHTSLAGSPEHDPYAPCSLDDLRTRGYAYWALGHIHKAAVLHEDPWIVYPGNLQGRHAKETGPKGCVLVDTDAEQIRFVTPVPLDVIRWHHLEVDLEGVASEHETTERLRHAVAAAHRNADGLASAMRLTLSGRTALASDFERRPQRWRQTVIELADEISASLGGEIWIERLIDTTHTPTAAPRHESAEDLIALMREIASDPHRLGSILQDIAEPLRARLPEELKDLPILAQLRDPAQAPDLIKRIEPRIAARLQGEETE